MRGGCVGGGQGRSETIFDEATERNGNTNVWMVWMVWMVIILMSAHEPSFDTPYHTFVDNFGIVPKIYLNI